MTSTGQKGHGKRGVKQKKEAYVGQALHGLIIAKG